LCTPYLENDTVCHYKGHQMGDPSRTNPELIKEISALKQKIKKLEQSESERKRASKALRESEEYFKAIIQNSSDIILIVDRLGNITYASPSVERFLGYGPDELIGKRSLDLIVSDDKPKAIADFGRALLTKEVPIPNVFRIRHKNGTERILEGVGKNLLDNPIVAGFVMNVRDITDRKQVEEALKDSEKRYRELSIIDDLTQLYNSRHFYFQLKIELDRSNRYEQPLTLLLLDLDNFKAFNDAYGHVEGDQVLLRLGQVVKRCLRQTDSAYRYGGEEFTILLPMTTSADGTVTAERIRTEFKKEHFSPVPGQDVHVTVSIGLAQYKMKEDMKAFVHRVDQLMYQGKKNGKDRVYSEGGRLKKMDTNV
jgi:diguanylate cyclase (GGDEF)-like protein/PAS domain S-box-containing protein